MATKKAINKSDEISSPQAAGILNVSSITLGRYVKDGRLTPVSGGGRGRPMWFKRSDVDALAKELRQARDGVLAAA